MPRNESWYVLLLRQMFGGKLVLHGPHLELQGLALLIVLVAALLIPTLVWAYVITFRSPPGNVTVQQPSFEKMIPHPIPDVIKPASLQTAD